ncbi:MAG: HlyD family efflux transporter periplasmic adaptor subunit, partial [Planctomycetales bacterium]
MQFLNRGLRSAAIIAVGPARRKRRTDLRKNRDRDSTASQRVSENNAMFRQKALDRLKSPEDLDHLLVIVNIRSWLIFITLTAACAGILAWSVLGTIPITINGFGVLIKMQEETETSGETDPETSDSKESDASDSVKGSLVKSLQSRGGGQVIEILIRPGDHVDKNDVIAIINQPELQKNLDQKAAEKRVLEELKVKADKVDDELREKVHFSITTQREFIDEEIEKSKELQADLEKENDKFFAKQTEQLQSSEALFQDFRGTLEEYLKDIEDLFNQRLQSKGAVLSARAQLMENKTKIADLELQLQSLDLKKIEREREVLTHKNRLADLALEKLKLSVREEELVREVEQNKESREAAIRKLTYEIEYLTTYKGQVGFIRTPYAGRILELPVSLGQIIGPGSRVGTIEVDDPNAVLVNLAYFSIKDGKKIKPGDQVRIAPATVQRERHGSLIGEVTKVSEFPVTRESAVHVIG